MTVSVLILTLNEEINIDRCIDSLSWCDDIIVFDSCSTDNTTAIAKSKGAKVVQRKFDNWSSHQNWAMSNIAFKYQWVFYIDADEICTPELAEEIQETTTRDTVFSAYRLRRKDYFMGTWLRRAQLYPTWIVRLFKPDKIRYERLVNPIAVVDGEIGELEGHINHFPFSHGVSHWIERHNRYSSMEAEELIKSRQDKPVDFRKCFSTEPNIRREMLKNIFFRLPFRPVIKFIYYYFFRMGLLDGRAGFTYSCLQAMYEYMISVKVVEIKRRNRDLPV